MSCEDKKPLKIAVTGPPAAGKSTILRMFAEEGVPVFSADEEVHKLSRPCQKGFHQIIAKFGEEFLTPGGELDRKRLLKAMLKDKKLKKALEGIFHPLVKDRLIKWVNENQGSSRLIAEIPLLYQAGWEVFFDKVIWVTAPEDVLIGRLTQRLGDVSLARALITRYFEDMPRKIFYDLKIDGTILPEKIKKRLKEHDLL
ncbi:dephospho-CoA kinase [Thermodesulfatator atlanticus]|uniref:dephospho-CoA kinase n=1 Tax=Thermodesulfatator atlanticus TaxID=501497 RepID=UPI0003B7B181|nr:dephospho-CoA kinase [Thermodesulfatator atlanticus]